MNFYLEDISETIQTEARRKSEETFAIATVTAERNKIAHDDWDH